MRIKIVDFITIKTPIAESIMIADDTVSLDTDSLVTVLGRKGKYKLYTLTVYLL